MGPSLGFSRVRSNPPPEPAPSRVPVQAPAYCSPALALSLCCAAQTSTPQITNTMAIGVRMALSPSSGRRLTLAKPVAEPVRCDGVENAPFSIAAALDTKGVVFLRQAVGHEFLVECLEVPHM